METKIFVIGIPSFGDVAEKIGEAISQVFDEPKQRCRCAERKTFTRPQAFKPTRPCGCGSVAPQNEWGIGGKPADENKRFGYGLEVDEPKVSEFWNRNKFLEARRAFDNFVDAGEKCRELGLEKKSNAPITKCQAIRQPVNCPPPMRNEVPGGNLIGESDFWDDDCFEW